MNKITHWILTVMVVLTAELLPAQNIVINEILTSNGNSITDEDGSHEDWIELYNTGANPVNLLGYGLTDDSLLLFKWTFPNITLNPGQYLLVWASDKNRVIAGSPLHTNFKISATGENILLTNTSAVTIASLPPVNIPTDVSYGTSPNGSSTYAFFGVPTPNAANTSTSYTEVLSPPVFSNNSAFTTAGFNLTITSPDAGTTILYTADGSEPNENNLGGTTYSYKNSYPKLPGQAFGPFLQNSFQTLLYSAPIPITDRSPLPNKVSNISTTFDYSPNYFPNGPIFKGTVIKAKVIKPGALSSKTITKNYFISPQGINRFTIPVVSLSFDENSFYDYTNGISVAGIDFDNWRLAHPNDPVNEDLGNFNRSGDLYEREANMNYFVNGQEVINQKVGLRIHGDYSRLYPSKSMRVYARSSYGNDKLSYPFFSDEPYTAYERVVIKNAGGDFYNTMFRDALCNELVKDLRMETEANKQVITFINGEYWGILAIRERYDNNYFKLVYNIDAVDLLENQGEVKEGDNIDYTSFFNYVQNNDLSQSSNYAYIQTRMDPDNYMDYHITNIFFDNEDWVTNNVVYWRKKTAAYDPTAPYGHDGRWRWAFHDVTSTFGNYSFDTLADATTTNTQIHSAWSTLILRKLLANDTFKIDFINRFADLMNTNFLPSRINAQIDVMAAEIAPEMNDQYFRWKGPVDNGDWQYHINREKTFANERPNYQRQHIRQKFGISSNINATLNVSDPAQGYIKMNTINIKDGTPGITGNPYPWTGVYFHNIPVKLKAVALSGYQFSHWSGASSSTNAEITITPTADFSVTAHFSPTGNVETSVPIYFWMMDSSIPNNTQLETLNSTFEFSTANAVLEFQSCLVGYPFSSSSPNYHHASMERRNSPTSVNYLPQANGNLTFEASGMRGLQIKQPFQNGGLENTMIFKFSTLGYKNIKFAFAILDEGAATGITLDYATNSGSPNWITTGLPSSAFTISNAYKRIEADLSAILAANDNPDLKIRIRFTGPNMTADSGNRVTFNNISVEGVAMTLTENDNGIADFMVYPNPTTTAIHLLHEFGTVNYKLMGIDGKMIQNGKIIDHEINIAQVPSGLYLLHLQTDDGKVAVKKIIKK